MNNKNLENKLTTSAKEALDELIHNYRKHILIEASQETSRYSGDVEEISVRDILTSVEKIDKRISTSTSVKSKRSMMLRLFRLFGVMGIIYAIGGFGYLAYQTLNIQWDYQETIGVTFGIIGVLMALGSYLYIKVYSEKYSDIKVEFQPIRPEYEGTMLVVQKWRDIELAIRNVITIEYGESYAEKPLSVLLEELVNSDIISGDEYRELRNLLSSRNAILHDGRVMNDKELRSMLLYSDQLLRKLESKSKLQ